MSIVNAYQKVLGRKPTDTEAQRMFMIRDAIGIKENDALFMIVLLMERYSSSWSHMSEAIKLNIQTASEAEIKKIEAHANELAYAVEAHVLDIQSKLAVKLADDVAGTLKRRSTIDQMLAACIGAVLGGFLVLLGFSLFASMENGSTNPPAWLTGESPFGIASHIIHKLFRLQIGGYVVACALLPLSYVSYRNWKAWRELRTPATFWSAIRWAIAMLGCLAVTVIGFWYD
jgi:hypothetical protein